MLVDERRYIRELGLRRILKARKSNRKGQIRHNELPQLIFNAEEYFEMIRWDNPLETPATLNLSDQDITRLIKSGSHFELEKLPCHTQAVERHVRLVTTASLATCGAEARDGFMHSRIKSQRVRQKNYFFRTLCGTR